MNVSVVFKSILFSLALGLTSSLPAQNLSLYLNKFSTNEGLITNTNNNFVFKDSQGYVWVGSLDGLCRFDGKTSISFRPQENDSFSLPDPIIHSNFFEDSQTNIWFNTGSSLLFYDRQKESFKKVELKKGDTTFNYLQVFHFDKKDETLWLFGDKDQFIDKYPLIRLNTINPEIVKIIDYVEEYQFEGLKTYYLTQSQEHLVVIPQKSGWEIRTYKAGKPSLQKRYQDPLKRNCRLYSSYQESPEKIWLGTEAGLMQIDLRGEKILEPPSFNGDSIRKIRGIVPYDSTTLLIGTADKGIFLFDTKSGRYISQVYTIEGGFKDTFNKGIHSFYLDNCKTLWISTLSQGIFYSNLAKNRFTSHLQQNFGQKTSHNVRLLTQGPNGNIWVVTNKGIEILNSKGELLPDHPISHQAFETFKNKRIFYLFTDRQENVWVCTNSGLFVFHDDRPIFLEVTAKFPNPNDKKSPVFTYIQQLQSGQFLASTYGKGMIKVVQDSNGVFTYTPEYKDSHKGSSYTLLTETKNQNILVSKDRNELQFFNYRTGSLRLNQRISFKPLVTAIQEDTLRDCFWVGSSQGLFQLIRLEDSLRLEKVSLLPPKFESIKGILMDSLGTLWMSTNYGLLQYDPTGVSEKSENPYLKKPFRLFDETDGLQANEFNFWAYTQTKDQQFIFGGTNGITRFSPLHIPVYPVEAVPTITRVEINGETLKGRTRVKSIGGPNNPRDQLLLNTHERSFGFYFSAMDYGHPEACQFRYVLKNKHGKEINSGNENYVKYFDLEPGEYVFELFASNAEGDWNSQPYQLALKLVFHPHETLWFKLMLALIILASIYALYRNQIEHIRKRHLLTELENTILRVQMNPHFIFNSLNSIRNYILDQDVDTADDYLVELAILMRRVLEIADKPHISIAQEVELLTKYMELEALRFEKAFTYNFDIDPALDKNHSLLPTMILQPFVENSILHGFPGKGSERHISIEFLPVKGMEYLVCKVTDNGIGRKAAAKKSNKHTSKALTLTQKRLQLIKDQTGKETQLEIVDLYDTEDNPLGTQVMLAFPVINP